MKSAGKSVGQRRSFDSHSEKGMGANLTRPRILCFLFALLMPLLLGSCGSSGSSLFLFEIVLRNISVIDANSTTASTPSGVPYPVVMSPTFVTLHTSDAPIFRVGEAVRGNGLEQLAEDGEPSLLVESLSQQDGIETNGVGQTVQETMNIGVLAPGESYRVVLASRSRNVKLSLVSGYLQANDIFVATPEAGIPLFDEADNPITANLSGQLSLLDAGTEVNEGPGEGPTQGGRQTEPGQGTPESNVVRPIDDGFVYPAPTGFIELTVAPVEEID